uniref:Sortilin N-terminal domain-containing protein n=1 Tax=Solibacter usitatus (strain Ellin6076) TaxID=234267 RepID=Q01WK1_SOLUE
MRFLALLLCAAAHSASLPANLYDHLHWRNIGPFRGGRVTAVSGVVGDGATFYFGSVGGGVWKTTNAGVTWSPIFDEQQIASIGAIAVAPSNPNVIYAGTGEADIRSQIGFGDGVYKSTDAGKTWTNVGLRDTRQIACIRVDPRNPDLVYVAALGHVYGPNAERGVFRSSDGGGTWAKVLDRGSETGAVDLALDPSDSRTIYATVWNARRPVWSTYAPIEGPGSGLFKSTDGGDHWASIAGRGLPEAQWGRSGVAVAAGGKRVYALIDAKGAGGLYRSDDAGVSWTRVSSDARITSRNWYFSGITVDPKNADVVYAPNVAVYRSTDGGHNFTVLKGAPGGDDYRILWIDPTETRRMVLGSDQGTNVSLDGGQTWSSWYNQPTAQMYHVVTDNQFPYHVYGAQQDSGTAVVPSRTNHHEIDARDWYTVSQGEAGYIGVDPKNHNIVYAGNTAGSLARFDKRTGEAQNISPSVGRGGFNPSTAKYRFPWTPPLVFSTTEPDTLYFGSQVLLKTTDGGLNWQEISGDLTGDTRKDKTPIAGPVMTANAREAGYGVIYTIAPSPLRAGMIWVGSDTGLIHLTRDGGKTWQNVTPPGLSAWSKVGMIEASHFDAGEAWAAIDRHRLEDYKPYVYRTRDYGKTWTLVAKGLGAPAFVNSVREDPVRRGLLYAGTELGAAVSFDSGDHWQSLQLNLPAVSVRDLAVHGDDLVIATFGRGFWILDGMEPLRQANERIAGSEVALLRPATAVRVNPEEFNGTPMPPEEPQAKNPPDGALIDYYLKSAAAGEVALEILDAKGDVVRKISSQDRAPVRPPGAVAETWYPAPERVTGRAGMNRFVWDLRYAATGAEDPESALGRPVQGPLVLPGTYTVRLTVDGKSVSQPLKVTMDPRSSATAVDLQKQFELSIAIWRDLVRAAEAAREDAGKREAITGVMARLGAALAVAESADRTPPATAYQLAAQARKDLAAALGK